MKALKDILNEGILGDVDTRIDNMNDDLYRAMWNPSKLSITTSHTYISWSDLGIELSKTDKRNIIDGYVNTVNKNKFYSDYEKRIKSNAILQYKDYKQSIYILSANIVQDKNKNPKLEIGITIKVPDYKYNILGADAGIMLSIIFPNDTNYTSDELIKLCYPVFLNIKENTTKLIKYMTKNWNTQISYENFIKL